MFAVSARSVPDMAFASSDSPTASNVRLSPSFAIFTSPRRRCDSVPRGPLMESASAASVASTPLGSVTGYFAMRDMAGRSSVSGDNAQHFATDPGGARLAVGHHALGGGDDGDAQPVHDLRKVVAPLVHAKPRSGDALDLFDHRLAGVVLQPDLELRLAFLVAHGETLDV